MSEEDRVAKIENELKELKKKKKDAWDRFQIIASLLIPASITFVGIYYSNQMKATEIATAREQAQKQEVLAEISSRVTQASVVSDFLEALASKEPIKRQLAVEGVMIALPKDGPRLALIVQQTDVDQNVKNTATSALDARRSTLVQQLFSEDATTRISAAQELTSSWSSDASLVGVLISYARQNRGNNNGVYNTVVVLNNLSTQVLRANKAELEAFSREAEANGDKTIALARQLREKIQ